MNTEQVDDDDAGSHTRLRPPSPTTSPPSSLPTNSATRDNPLNTTNQHRRISDKNITSNSSSPHQQPDYRNVSGPESNQQTIQERPVDAPDPTVDSRAASPLPPVLPNVLPGDDISNIEYTGRDNVERVYIWQCFRMFCITHSRRMIAILKWTLVGFNVLLFVSVLLCACDSFVPLHH